MTKTVRVLGLIPARGGSKRIARKNIVHVAGKPLLSYTIQAAKTSKRLDAFLVSTDDKEIAALAESLGADVPFLRPKKFATDTSPDIEYVQHALAWVEKNRKWKPEIIVLLPPDAPLRTGKDIDHVIQFLLDENLDSVRTLKGPILHPSLKAMWVKLDPKKKKIDPLFPEFVGKPSQQVPEYYISVALIYATRAKFIKKGTLWGPKIGGYPMKMEQCIEIDEPEQLQQVEAILRKRNA